MTEPVLTAIIKQSIQLEGSAMQAYNTLAGQNPEGPLKEFWKDMAAQEWNHVSYWKTLLQLAEERKIRNIFDDPDKVLSDLMSLQIRVNELLEDCRENPDLISSFLLAYRLEIFVMHPAFAAMFYIMRSQTGDKSPVDNYEAHIDGLFNAMQKFTAVKPELQMIAELARKLWMVNLDQARHLADIMSLREMIPICMHCKNVRNDQGFWDKVETYVGKHMSVDFSHGICPDCMKKYYSEYT